MERGRKLQSIVPDLSITIPVEGNPTPSLHEVKVISSSKTKYTPHRQAEIAINTALLGRSFSVCALKAQAFSLLSRLDMVGKGTAAAIKRQNFSLQQERRWAQLRQAHAISVQQGKALLRRGHLKLD